MGFMDEYNKALQGNKQKSGSGGSNNSGGSSYMEEYNKAFGMTTRNDTKTTSRTRDIAPLSDRLASRMTVGKKKKEEEKKKRKWFEKGLFEDGYDVGDVTKTILGTAGDVAIGAVKGFTSGIEGITDLGMYGVAGILDAAGKDDSADSLRESTSRSRTDQLWGGLEATADKYSVLGDKADAVIDPITQALGYIGLMYATAGIGAAAGVSGAGATALSTGAMFASSAGGSMGEAYQGGATDEEAFKHGVMKGAVDAGSELIFGGLGKTAKALGLSRGLSSLDDIFAKKLSEKISNHFWKNAVEYGVKASAEGMEEVLAGLGSAVSKKLTYMSDEELSKLIKDENLLEQFAVGTAASAIMQSGYVPGTTEGSLKEANATGRDFISGLSQNEQKVIDKVYSDRVAEAEKSGKVSQGEKNKIYDKVVSDMDKGYLSIDTIEEVLGGDSYKNYKKTIDAEDAQIADLEKQIKELEGAPNTVGNAKKYDALQAKLDVMNKRNKSNDLKSRLEKEVYEFTKGDRLAESYNERARTGQKFEADVTQYDAKQQAVIKKAIDSGILNNTNRTHEFVDIISKISADKGVLFDFTNNAKLKESGFAIDGKQVNGFVTKDGISLNIDSPKAWQTTVGHEVTHVLEGTELYTELQNTLFEYAKTKGEYDSRYQTLTEIYKDVQDTDINAEITADLVGEYLFTDENFINNLSTKNRNVFQKIYDEIKYLYKVATGSKEARELEQVKRAFEKAYREGGKAQNVAEPKNTGGITNPTLLNAIDQITNIGRVTNSMAETILRDPEAVGQIVKQTNAEITGTRAAQRNIVKEAMYQIAGIKDATDEIAPTVQNAKSQAVQQTQNNDAILETQYQYQERRNNVQRKNSVYAELQSARSEQKNLQRQIERMEAKIRESGKGSPARLNQLKTQLEQQTNLVNQLQSQYDYFVEDYDRTLEGAVQTQQDLFEQAKQEVLDAIDAYNAGEITKAQLDEANQKYDNAGREVFRLKHMTQEEYSKELASVGMVADRQNMPNAKSTPAVATKYSLSDSDGSAEDIDISNAYDLSYESTGYERVPDNLMGFVGEGKTNKGFENENYPYTLKLWVSVDGGYGFFKDEIKGMNRKHALERARRNWNDDGGGSVILKDRTTDMHNGGAKYSLSDSNGRHMSPATAKRFGNSKVVDENGSLKVVYHGTASGEFTVFDKAKGSVEGDFGSGFYFTDNESDVSEHYEGGGPDFENKVARLAEQIEADEDIDYDEAEERARAELYKGSHKFEVYLNIENPAVVGKTYLFDSEFVDRYNEEDFEDYDDYIAETEQAVADAIDEIIWEVEKNVDVYSTDGLADIIYEAYYEGGIGLEELKEKINNLCLEDNNGNLVGNEVARQIIESLGYDGIIDPTVSGKWNMDIEDGTTHYIVFKPNQIKAVTNQNPTDNPDIHRSLSKNGEQHTPDSLSALRLETGDDIAPVAEESPVVAENATTQEAPIYESNDKSAPEGQTAMFEPVDETPKRTTRKEYHQSIIDNVKDRFDEKGFDFDKVLKNAKNLSTWSTVDNTPQRVMEKALGHKAGGILADITVNKVAQNETEGIKWLNKNVELLKQISKDYNIKPGSKKSAAAQMYAEGFYVDENNNIVQYGDRELAIDFPNPKDRQDIIGLARDSRIRKMYDDVLASINESRTRNLYPEIPRLDNYFLHFRAMEDTFSTLGLPFNPNDIRAKDLPTDLNGVTADLKPGQPFFSSAMHRTGKRTSFDLLGGVERYLNSAKNQIYHIDDIQTLRALRNYIAETYGQATGLEDLDSLTDAEAEERIKQVYDSHLSTFAKFLNEEANVLAGKTALIDRGIEGIIGRRGITFLNTLNKQVGSNMVGYNVSSSLTNFLPVAQTFAKTNKFDFAKAFTQTVANKLSGGRFDSFAKDSPVVIRRKGEDRFYQTPWQKMANPGYALMGMVDDVSTEIIARTKYNEFTRKGMDSQKAHFETDKWVSKLMGDRSLGQQPQLYNSKMLGLITKFQLEVRNQLDSQFYDTIQETKASNEHIENGLLRNAKTAAKVASTFTQLAVAQHLFGKAFESIAGYNPAFDIIEVLMTAFGYDDEEESEDTALDNFAQGLLALAEDLPYVGTFTGGRVPISEAIPNVSSILKGEDEYGNEIGIPKALWENTKDIAPYYLMPGGYGQAKKTVAGLKMFSDDHPVAGSYTEAGNMRFPVEDTLGSRVKAGIFGQYASENARKYFDQEQRTLNPEQTEIFAGLNIPIEEYWEYRDNLYEFYDVRDQLKDAAYADEATDEDVLRYTYINNAYGNIYDLYDKQKEIASGDSSGKTLELRMLQKQMKQMLSESKYGVDSMKLYGAYGEVGDKRYNKDADSGRWYEIKPKNADGSDNWYYQKEQEVTRGLGISYEEYWNNREEYNYAYDKPGRYAIAQTVGGYDSYMEYYDVLENWQSDNYLGADKDSKGNSISGSRKKKVIEYINGLDLDDGEKIILYRTVYSSKADKRAYNMEIIDYLNSRDDISYQEMKTILEELEMEVDSEGNIAW